LSLFDKVMASKIASDISALGKKFTLLGTNEFRGETTVQVDRAAINEVCRFCRDTLGYSVLIDLSGVDNFGDEPRFEVVKRRTEGEKRSKRHKCRKRGKKIE